MIFLIYEKRHRQLIQIMGADRMAQAQALFIQFNFPMRAIFFIAIVALAVGQFNLPNVGDLGNKVVKELANAEKEVEHLTKQEVQKVQEIVKEGIDYITGKPAQQEKKPETQKVEQKKKVDEIVPENSLQVQPFIMIGGAPVDLNQNNIEQAMEEKLELAEKAEEKDEEIKMNDKVEQVIPLPPVTEKKESFEQKTKKIGHKKQQESESSSDISEEQSERSSSKHGKGKHGKHGKNKEYTPEELQKRLQERDQKHRKKAEWKKNHEKKNSQKESKGQRSNRKHQSRSRSQDRSAYYRKHPKSSDISLPTTPEPQHVQILAKLKVNSP